MPRRSKPRLPTEKKNEPAHRADGFPPLDLDQEHEALCNGFVDRLAAVFEKYGCEPTWEGWQQLALELMLTYEPAIKKVNSMQRMTDDPNFYTKVAIHRKHKAERKRAIADIAREVAPAWGKKAETLEARYSSTDKHMLDRRNLSEAVTRHVSRRIALRVAADRISRATR